MSRHPHTYATGAVFSLLRTCGAVVLLCLCIWIAREQGAQKTASYYAALLHTDTDNEAVVLHGTTYQVERGVISPEVSAPDAEQILQLAYARLLAREDPLLDLEGTDPKKLREEAVVLGKQLVDLSHVQKTPVGARLAGFLYPVQYLAALADTEEARQTFLADSTKEHKSRYEQALAVALRAGRSDIRGFAQAFAVALPTSTPQRIAGMGGTLTTDRMQRSITDIEQGLAVVAGVAKNRRRCTDGHLASCGAFSMHRTDVSSLLSGADTTARTPSSTVATVRGLLAEARNFPALTTRQAVEISTSVCAAVFPGPYVYLLSMHPDTTVGRPPRPISQLFFYPVESSQGDTIQYMRSTLDMSLVLVNPNSYYQCPESGEDLSRLLTTTAVADFAQKHPDIEPELGSALSATAPVIQERVAREYLQKALVDTSSTASERQTLRSLARRYKNNGAGLDKLVEQISRILTQDLTIKKNRVPFDMQIRDLLLTHSGYYSLFEAYNPAFGSRTISLRDINVPDTETYFAHLRSYDSAPSIPHDKLVHDIRAFFEFENQ